MLGTTLRDKMIKEKHQNAKESKTKTYRGLFLVFCILLREVLQTSGGP
ncbi:mCG1049185, isoform CRA_a [Mus musculus]|nr:mCG1049185, isoform CRA_a [Mus musculus]EDL30247.1 mCG1049185, isoform CRA_a [Mus musculus]